LARIFYVFIGLEKSSNILNAQLFSKKSFQPGNSLSTAILITKSIVYIDILSLIPELPELHQGKPTLIEDSGLSTRFH
jgi:hypothetical protein